MAKTFAEAMAEVQNRANMLRKEIHAEAWGGELAPGGRGIIVNEKPLPSSELEAQIAEVHAQRNQSVKDMTKENWDETIPVTDIASVEHINKVEEAKKAMTVNKSSNLLDQWKKNNIPQSGALNVPIPTMKEPPLVKEDDVNEWKLSDIYEPMLKKAQDSISSSNLDKRADDFKNIPRTITREPGSPEAKQAAAELKRDKAAPSVGVGSGTREIQRLANRGDTNAQNAIADAKKFMQDNPEGAKAAKAIAAEAPKPTKSSPTKNVVARDKAAPSAAKPAGSSGSSYKINRGDTLSSISRKTGLSIQQIAKQNNIKDVNKIAAGRTLNLSGSKPAAPASPSGALGLRGPSSSAMATPRPSTAGAVAQDTKPKVTTAPLPPRRPAPKVNTTPSGGTGAAGGNPTPVGGSIIDRQNRNTTPNQSRPAPAPAPVPKIERQQRNTAPSQNRGVVAPPVGGSVPPQTSTSSTAISRPQDTRGQEKFMKKELNNSYENPLIAAFFALQEKEGNMFAEAKKKTSSQAKKYSEGDKDEINDDPGSPGAVPTGGSAIAESIQKAARVSMFDPAQGYSRTAGSADGAASLKDRIAAAWNNLSTGFPATQPAVNGMTDEMAADAAALKEETEVLDEAPKKKEHELARLAAAAISRGHKVTKLPAGKAEGWADNNVKSSMGGGVAKVNSQSGTKTKARFREEVEVEEETLEEKHVYHVSWGVGLDHEVTARHGDEAVKKAKSALIAKTPKLKDPKYADTFNKKPTVHNMSKERTSQRMSNNVQEEQIEEGKANGHKMTDMDKHLKGYYNVFGRHPIQKNDKLASKVWNKPAADMRMTKSGKIHGQDQKAKANEIKGRLGYHTKAKLPEGVEFSEEELNHIYNIMENNPEGNAIAGRDPNTKQGDSDKSTVGGIANESKKNGIRR